MYFFLRSMHFHKLFSFFLVFSFGSKYFRDIWGRYLEIPTVSASLIILIFKLNPRASSNHLKNAVSIEHS